MFEKIRTAHSPEAAPLRNVSSGSLDIDGWISPLAQQSQDVSDDARLRLIRSLEELKSAAAAAQACLAVEFADSQAALAASAETTSEELDSLRRRKRLLDARVAAQLGHARRESPHAGRAFLRTSRELIQNLPHTFAALRSGHLSEPRAGMVVRETACLEPADRRHVDTVVSADAEQLARLGTQKLQAAVKVAAYRTDPEVFVNRAAYAVSERRVSLRPAPDTMVWLSALLPVAQGVAAFAALTRQAASARAAGDSRGRGQVMADTLVERMTGAAEASGVPLEINLVMTDRTLLGADSEPGRVHGYGPIPAEVARQLARHSVEGSQRALLRRLYTAPDTGQLVAMDSRARLFPAQLAKLITLRDQTCRTTYCDAPIRHIDHVKAAAESGETSFENGQGLCEFCNYAKEAVGWSAGAGPPQGPPPDPVGTRSYPPDLYFPPLRLLA